jgi:hypothetical protein
MISGFTTKFQINDCLAMAMIYQTGSSGFPRNFLVDVAIWQLKKTRCAMENHRSKYSNISDR